MEKALYGYGTGGRVVSFLGATWAIFLKDLKIELRSKEIILTTALFSLLVVLLSAFAFNLNTLRSVDVSAGVLWIAAFMIYLIVYAPILSRPRVDGKPG